MLKGPMQPRCDVLWEQRHTNSRSSCEQSSFMQFVQHSLAGYGLSWSSRELRRQLPHCYCPPASGTMQQVPIICHCGHSPASRSTFSTDVLIPSIMVPQPIDDTTMLIQLSCNSRLSSTYQQPSDESHRENGFFYSCFPLWLSWIPRNYRCLRTEA
ncbi:hypothetical protein AVEN_157875-1 [Araneus ventricosus]|uniref:Uncharacterized protein n=1 Tax=Araneus ventricosus TaxID=182803 RepID=A0A4Y2V8X1_ARAVE|nr:hypothetical protein AVEN_42084-1 [Araneus ventricosus]GBO20972.1 hypothetical protein AVEN_157875-1 [Araneus ventricosus]